MEQRRLVDSFGRHHNYLRLSVTDRCNLRCTYCMGPHGVRWLDREKILTYEEILEVVNVAATLGINRIRLTGGEPLVRKGLAWLIREIRRIPGIGDLSLTTNGLLLAEQAVELRQAGLDRVNVSLDSLDPATYARITRGGDLARVLAGIETAMAVGLSPLKINVVLMKGLNDRDLPRLLSMAYEQALHLRFIEYMPIWENSREQPGRFLPTRLVRQTASSMGMELIPVTPAVGNGPAVTFTLAGGMGTVGLISPLSKHFCSSCNRLRLTAEGHLKPCLYWQDELPLRPSMGRPEEIQRLFFRALSLKRAEHRLAQAGQAPHDMRCMSRIGG